MQPEAPCTDNMETGELPESLKEMRKHVLLAREKGQRLGGLELGEKRASGLVLGWWCHSGVGGLVVVGVRW